MVPCNGCTACCRGHDVVVLRPGEETRFASHRVNGKWILARDGKGDCHYVTDDGCSIQGDKPRTCVEYDCRKAVRRYGDANAQIKAVSLGTLKRSIYEAARTR